jgi:hypothetical protein
MLIHCLFTAYSLTCPLSVGCLFTVCSLPNLDPFTVKELSIHGPATACMTFTHLSIVCSLSVLSVIHCLFAAHQVSLFSVSIDYLFFSVNSVSIQCQFSVNSVLCNVYAMST